MTARDYIAVVKEKARVLPGRTVVKGGNIFVES